MEVHQHRLCVVVRHDGTHGLTRLQESVVRALVQVGRAVLLQIVAVVDLAMTPV